MALLYLDGFEGYGTTPGSAVDSSFQDRWTVSGDFALMDVENGQYGKTNGRSLQWPTTTDRGSKSPDLGLNISIWAGFGIKIGDYAGKHFFSFIETGGTVGMSLYMTATGRIHIMRSGTWRTTVREYAMPLNCWQYFEFYVLSDNSAGAWELKINGITMDTATGQDTRSSGTSGTRQVRLFGTTIGPFFDNLYVDDAGFRGIRRVDHILPNGDDSIAWTPDSGTTNYTQVDEDPPDDDTAYVEDSTLTNQDLYDYEAHTDLDSVDGLQVNTQVRLTDATPFSLKTLVKSGSTTSADAGTAIGGTSYEWLSRISEINPDTTNPWTPAEINSAKFGVETG